MPHLTDPRGIRNNNPGNIRLSETRWQGRAPLQADPEFITFIEPVWGLRALMKTLLTYNLKYELDTVRSLINRYAPPAENDTGSYICDVARRLGVTPDDPVDLRAAQTLTDLAGAIVCHENGRPPKGRAENWYDASVYARAVALVFAQKADA